MKGASLSDVRIATFTHAWPPTARSIPWRAPLGAAALVVVVIAQHRVTHQSADAGSFMLRAQLVAAAAAAAAATTLEDPAAALVATSPTMPHPKGRRTTASSILFPLLARVHSSRLS